MTSFPLRDQVNDHLLTSKNAAMIFIDHQPSQISAISSMDLELLVDNRYRFLVQTPFEDDAFPVTR